MKFKRTKKHPWRAVMDGVVIVNMTTGDYFALNETGLKVWQMCDGRHDFSKITSHIVKHYGADFSAASRDVEKLIDQLRELKLIEIST